MRAHLYAACAILLLARVATAQQKSTLDVEMEFRAAQQKELVDGDLRGAIEKYRAVVSQAGSNRAIAAKALVRMAECYQKQGDTEARRLFERVIREYPEQQEAVALAQARLKGSPRTPVDSGAVVRKVWAGDILGTISGDGRRLSFTDWSSGNVAVHDFASGTDRTLTGNKPGSGARNAFAEESAVSKDGKQVAYTWYDDNARRYELRIVNVESGSTNPPRLLFHNQDQTWIAPWDWSPDGKWLAVTASRKDLTTQLGLVSTVDGSFRVLKSMGWSGPGKVFFSPNGKYLAFDAPATDTTVQHDIFVLAVDGSREVPAVVHPSDDLLMGWSPGGTHLLFASDRSGSFGLWALAFDDGKTRGAPFLIKSNIESNWSMGVTRDGALYLGTSTGNTNVVVASVDLTTGKELAPSAQPIQQFVGSNASPDWSPDGKQIAFIATREPRPRNRAQVVGIWSRETGTVRENARLPYVNSVKWNPDGRSLLLGGKDSKGRSGIFLADAQSGAVTPVALTSLENFVGHFPQWSPDGKKIFYRMPSMDGSGGSTFIERDVATGREREVSRGALGRISVSPDGEWIATVTVDSSTKASSLILIPIKGGDSRTVLRVAAPQLLGVLTATWTRDGRALIVNKASPPSVNELWVVPIDGGAPRKLDVAFPGRTAISLHPDGRQLAFNTAVERKTEVWVLEGVLSSLASKP